MAGDPACRAACFTLIDGDPSAPFLVPIAITLAAGRGLERLETKTEMYTREASLMVSLSWLCVGLLGALPFVIAGPFNS
jgi:trk system potassium uptake protein TrkH